MQIIAQIPLIDLKGIIPYSTCQKFEAKRVGTWYAFTHEAFLDYL